MNRKRYVPVYIAIIFMFSLLSVRLYYLAYGAGITELIETSGTQYSRKLDIAQRRGFIYDRNGNNLAGIQNGYITLIDVNRIKTADTKFVKSIIRSSGITEDEFIGKIKNKVPFRLITDSEFTSEYTFSVPYYKRYLSYYPAVHLIGYIDKYSGDGITGIEYYYNQYLKNFSGYIYMTYQSDANSRLLGLYPLVIHDNGYCNKKGITLTLDLNLQRAVESLDINKGAVVVANARTGEILASASFPTFDPENISVYLDSENGELINRVFNRYTPGSLFKIVAACALLEGDASLSKKTYNCTGERCYAKIAHGEVNMSGAIEKSCNGYFISMKDSITKDDMVKISNKIQFGTENFIDLLYCGNGTISADVMSNAVIGQGNILVTPIEVTRMMCAIINNGIVHELSYVKTENNNLKKSKRVMSVQTAETLREMLKLVITDGIGSSAKPLSDGEVGGKTASAQSGQLDINNKEIIHSWFCGFYENYVITVFCEDLNYGAAASRFSQVADYIQKYVIKY